MGSKITVDEGILIELKSRINCVRKVLGGTKVFNCRAMGMNVKRRLYEEVTEPAETWSMGVVGKKLSIMEMRDLRSMCGVTPMDRVRNEEMQRRIIVMR